MMADALAAAAAAAATATAAAAAGDPTTPLEPPTAPSPPFPKLPDLDELLADGFTDELGSGGVLLKVLRGEAGGGGEGAGGKGHGAMVPDFKQQVVAHVRGRVRADGTTTRTTATTTNEWCVDTRREGKPMTVYVGENVMEPVPPGVMLALRKTEVGETVRVVLDSRYAFGEEGHPGWGVPPNAAMEFEVTVLDVGEHWKEPPEMSVEEMAAFVATLKARGNEYFSWGKLDRAMRCFKEGVRYGESGISSSETPDPALHRDLVACLNNIAIVLEKQGKLKEAKEAATQAIVQDPRNIKALVRAARIALVQAEHEEAAAAIKMALEIAPENPDVVRTAHKVKEAIDKVKQTEKQTWGGFLKPVSAAEAADAAAAKQHHQTNGSSTSSSSSSSSSGKVVKIQEGKQDASEAPPPSPPPPLPPTPPMPGSLVASSTPPISTAAAATTTTTTSTSAAAEDEHVSEEPLNDADADVDAAEETTNLAASKPLPTSESPLRSQMELLARLSILLMPTLITGLVLLVWTLVSWVLGFS